MLALDYLRKLEAVVRNYGEYKNEMTQEQAQEILATVNGKLETRRLEAVNLLFKEIDELKMTEEDAQQYALKCRKELEALQHHKNNCDTCKWDDYCGTEENCLSSKYIKDRYEPK